MTDMITLPRAEVRQALEALENSSPDQYPDIHHHYDSITALRERLAREEQEPVAKVRVHRTGGNAGIAWSVAAVNDYESLPPLPDGTPLYTAPQTADCSCEKGVWCCKDECPRTAAQPAVRTGDCTLCGHCAATGEPIAKRLANQPETSSSPDAQIAAHAKRLALELECLLLDANHPAVSRWWDSAHEALEQYRADVDRLYPQDHVSPLGKD